MEKANRASSLEKQARKHRGSSKGLCDRRCDAAKVVIFTEEIFCGVSWDACSMLDLLVTAFLEPHTCFRTFYQTGFERDVRIGAFLHARLFFTFA
jgi:hypothetical protein